MTEREYLSILKNYIKVLTVEEQEDILMEYSNHFYEERKRGRSDEEISIKLGNPELIGKDLIAGHRLKNAKIEHSFKPLIRAAISVISLRFINLMTVGIPMAVLILFSLPFMIFAALMLISPLFLMMGIIGYGLTAFAIHEYFFVLGYFGTGIVMTWIISWLWDKCYVYFLNYLYWNKRQVERRFLR